MERGVDRGSKEEARKCYRGNRNRRASKSAQHEMRKKQESSARKEVAIVALERKMVVAETVDVVCEMNAQWRRLLFEESRSEQ